MVEQPAVSSLRVEKSGRSKFAPVFAGERRKAAPAAHPSTDQQHISAAAGAAAEPVDAATPADASNIMNEIALGFLDDAAPSAHGESDAKRQTTIESVAARRDRRRSVSQSFTETSTTTATGTAIASAGGVNFTQSERNRVTMAHFLKDTGVGLPMKQSTVPSSSNNKSPKKMLTRSSSGVGNSPQKSSSSRPAAGSRSVAMAIAPRVRVVNGEIVLDEEAATMVSAQATGQPEFPMDVVNESGRHLTSHAFVKTIGNNRWSRADTELFYDALSMCGTDFAMISLLFPKRSREQIKGKFKVEERANPTRIALALKTQKPLDTTWLERAKKERQVLENK